ncbi:hypothetical protein [Dyella sp. 2HG41-7]|uniref:hypothetical protein n=1 Tax=Dyella sp. 2HG41-7 TaxID=2883239 RepID=UPI001F2FAE41|nr:hypothetical protein [Dyella sp. 2HG41-7]
MNAANAVWIVVGLIVAVGLWWLLVMRKEPSDMIVPNVAGNNSDQLGTEAVSSPERSAKVDTQSAGLLQLLAVITLISWPILWFAAAGESSWVLFFVGCAALSQGIFLWGFSNIIENLAHIRHNTNKALRG